MRRTTRNIIMLAVLLSLIVIIHGKFFFQDTSNTFFYIYGVTVTSTVFLLFFISHRYQDPAIEIMEKNLNAGKKRPKISCILAVFNEEKVIKDCVNSLINSDYENKEIIVVNDASKDKTLEVLKRNYTGIENVTILDLKENVGKKRAISEGAKIATGEIYVFTDSDSIVEKTAIRRCIEIMIHDPDIGAVSGHGRALNADKNIITKIQDSWYEGQFSVKKAFESVFYSVTCVSGPLAVFRKSAIFNYFPAWANDTFLGSEFRFSTDRTLTGFVLGNKEMGPFLKEKYKDSWFVTSNDYPVRDWKITYCKSAKVWTTVPDSFRRLIKQQIRWKKSFIRNIFFTGRFYWRKPFLAALRYYLSILFVFMGPIIVFRQLIWLPMHGNYISFPLYIGGVFFIGSLYSIAYRIENPGCNKWIYRPLMSILSTTVISWLLFYSLLTIRKNIWDRS